MSVHEAYHIYATLRLAAVPSSPWTGEVAVCGWRFAVAGGTQHGLDEGDVALDMFHAQDAAVSRTVSWASVTQGWAGVSGDGTHEVTDGDKDGIAGFIAAYFNAEAGYIPNDYAVQDVRLYPIGADGKTATSPDIYTPSTTMQGTDSSTWPGPSNALVVSTNTATRGPKGRGRWYLGPVSNINGADGLVPSSIRTAASGAAKTMFDDIRNIGSPASARYAPIVFHRGTTHGSIINSVRVGDEIDQMQSRRRQRKETYTVAALA